MKRTVLKSRGLAGEVNVPGDKSITHRALMIAAVAQGWSELHGALNKGDPQSTLKCLRQLGVETDLKNGIVRVRGRGLRGLEQPLTVLNAGNSGTTLRLLTGLLVGQHFDSEITGDESLSRRPMERIIDPLSRMGARLEGTTMQTPPLRIHAVGGLQSIDYSLPLPSAQVKSAIVFAALYADGITRIRESVRSRDHTERMLGLRLWDEHGVRIIEVEGGMTIDGRSTFIPGDTSSAAFVIVGATLVPNSEVLLKNVCLNPTRIAVIDILQSMGANIAVENTRVVDCEPVGDLVVRSSNLKTDFSTRGAVIANIMDEIPILSVAAACAEGCWEIRNADDLRNKESNRLHAIVSNLRSAGASVEEYADGFVIEGGKRLSGVTLESFGDHRIAMMCGVLGLVAEGKTEILGAETTEYSFPSFWDTLGRLSS